MPLSSAEREAIKLEVFNAMYDYGYNNNGRSIYGSEPAQTLDACTVFLSKPMEFQRQLLIMVAERQVFSYSSGGNSYSFQERCRYLFLVDPNVWGTQQYSGEEALNIMKAYNISQKPEFYRCVFVGIFSAWYAQKWAHWLKGMVVKDPNQLSVQTGLFNYEKTTRWDEASHSTGYEWSSLRDFVVGTKVGNNITYGLLPKLWVDAIDALEPQGTTGTLRKVKSPPPVYIFSLDTLPSFDKNTFVMVDLLEETPPATFQDLLASKVKLRGKEAVFNALFVASDKTKRERKRIIVNPTTETFVWDNTNYVWTRNEDASDGTEIIYETKNYLKYSTAMDILNSL
jgi:hypothetical protein